MSWLDTPDDPGRGNRIAIAIVNADRESKGLPPVVVEEPKKEKPMAFTIRALQIGGILFALVLTILHQPTWAVWLGFAVHGFGDYLYIRKNGI